MIIIGESKKSKYALVRLEATDRLQLDAPSYPTWTITTAKGLTCSTYKVGYPNIAGVLFLGGKDDRAFFCIQPTWVTAALKAYHEDKPCVVRPFENEAEAKDYIAKHGNKDPNFADLRDLNNWTIYPED